MLMDDQFNEVCKLLEASIKLNEDLKQSIDIRDKLIDTLRKRIALLEEKISFLNKIIDLRDSKDQA